MIKEAINRILELAKPEIIRVDGIEFSNQVLCQVKPPTSKEPLFLNSLSGLVKYIDGAICDDAKDDDEKIFIHIVSPTKVAVISELDAKHRERELFAVALYGNKGFNSGIWYDTESFMIRLRTQFVRTKELDTIISIVSNVVDEQSIKYSDDGLSQTVQIKSGIAKKREADLPNPVTLKPFRTFPEIDQPLGLFILRSRKTDSGPEWSLFNADNDHWKLEAMANIEKYLNGNNVNVDSIFS